MTSQNPEKQSAQDILNYVQKFLNIDVGNHDKEILNNYTEGITALIQGSNINKSLKTEFNNSVIRTVKLIGKANDTDDTINLINRNALYICSYFTGNVNTKSFSIYTEKNIKEVLQNNFNKAYGLVGHVYIYNIKTNDSSTRNINPFKPNITAIFKFIKNNDTEFIDTNMSQYHDLFFHNVIAFGQYLKIYKRSALIPFLIKTRNPIVPANKTDMNNPFTKNSISNILRAKLFDIAHTVTAKILSPNDNKHYFNHDELIVLLGALIFHYGMPEQFRKTNQLLINSVIKFTKKTSSSNKEYHSFDQLYIQNDYNNMKSTNSKYAHIIHSKLYFQHNQPNLSANTLKKVKGCMNVILHDFNKEQSMIPKDTIDSANYLIPLIEADNTLQSKHNEMLKTHYINGIKFIATKVNKVPDKIIAHMIERRYNYIYRDASGDTVRQTLFIPITDPSQTHLLELEDSVRNELNKSYDLVGGVNLLDIWPILPLVQDPKSEYKLFRVQASYLVKNKTEVPINQLNAYNGSIFLKSIDAYLDKYPTLYQKDPFAESLVTYWYRDNHSMNRLVAQNIIYKYVKRDEKRLTNNKISSELYFDNPELLALVDCLMVSYDRFKHLSNSNVLAQTVNDVFKYCKETSTDNLEFKVLDNYQKKFNASINK